MPTVSTFPMKVSLFVSFKKKKKNEENGKIHCVTHGLGSARIKFSVVVKFGSDVFGSMLGLLHRPALPVYPRVTAIS